MNREAFIAALQNQSPHHFIEDQLFDRIPFLFGLDRATFARWKRELGEQIDVDPACITLVGSGATGFSMNPNKNFKPFDVRSDVDVAVVSPYHFNVGWRYLRTNGARRIKLNERTRIAWDEHVTKYIYWGTLATDRLLGVLPFGEAWLRATSRMSGIVPTEGRDVNLRIYTDFDALRAYQIQSVRTLRDSMTR